MIEKFKIHSIFFANFEMTLHNRNRDRNPLSETISRVGVKKTFFMKPFHMNKILFTYCNVIFIILPPSKPCSKLHFHQKTG